jgi:hypothetical protein
MKTIVLTSLVLVALGFTGLFYCLFRLWKFFKSERMEHDDNDPYSYY